MKKVILALCVTVGGLITQSFAQEVRLEGVAAKNFAGLKKGDESSYYTYYFKEKPDNPDSASLVINVYDQMLQMSGSTTLQLSRSAQVAGSAFNGHHLFFIFVDPVQKTRTMMLIDRMGPILKRKDETEIKADLLAVENFPVVHTVQMNDFLVIRPEKGKKQGYALEIFDMELEKRTSKSFLSDDALSVEDIGFDMERIYLLQKEKQHDGEVYSIRCVDVSSMNTLFTTELRMGPDFGTPGFINVTPMGITTAGTFHREDHSKQAGLFFAKLDLMGTVEKINYFPWEMLKNQMKSELLEDLAAGKKRILIEDVLVKPDNTGYTVIGELYNKSGGDGNTVFTITDYVLFHFAQPDGFVRLDKLEKTPKELSLTGAKASADAGELANWLYKRNFFTYRGKIDMPGKPLIVYQNDENSLSKGYYLSSDSINKEGITRVDIDREVAVEESRKHKNDKQIAAVNKYNLASTEKDIENFTNEQSYKFISPATNGRLIFYNYQYPNLVFGFFPVNVR
jgi:hypothetical protein